MSQELTTYDTQALSPQEITRQVNAIQQVMKANMKVDTHYGTIRGCGNKPTLLKPGAEKLGMMFRLAAEFEVEQIPEDDDHITYRVVCKLNHIKTGECWGSGVGACSTKESKYAWREAVSDEEYMFFESEGKARIKFKYGNQQEYQVQTNPHDMINTVLKMAKKRAHVDAIITATAAGDIFTQDIEDFPDEMKGGGAQTTQSSTSKVELKPDQWMKGTIKSYLPHDGKKPHAFTFDCEGTEIKLTTFDRPKGWDDDTIKVVIKNKDAVSFKFFKNQKGYLNLQGLLLYDGTKKPEQSKQEQQPEQEPEVHEIEGQYDEAGNLY